MDIFIFSLSVLWMVGSSSSLPIIWPHFHFSLVKQPPRVLWVIIWIANFPALFLSDGHLLAGHSGKSSIFPTYMELRYPQHANSKTVGYVSSGFWGGITIGRFLWGYYMPRYMFLQNQSSANVDLPLLRFTFSQRKYIVQGCLYVMSFCCNRRCLYLSSY
jgi:hypothetical protein